MTPVDAAICGGWLIGLFTGFIVGTWVKGRWWHSYPTAGERKPE